MTALYRHFDADECVARFIFEGHPGLASPLVRTGMQRNERRSEQAP